MLLRLLKYKPYLSFSLTVLINSADLRLSNAFVRKLYLPSLCKLEHGTRTMFIYLLISQAGMELNFWLKSKLVPSSYSSRVKLANNSFFLSG